MVKSGLGVRHIGIAGGESGPATGRLVIGGFREYGPMGMEGAWPGAGRAKLKVCVQVCTSSFARVVPLLYIGLERQVRQWEELPAWRRSVPINS